LYKTIGAQATQMPAGAPILRGATTVFKFFVFDHENSQIKIKKITKIKK
jgi:hypothetical protein